MREFTEQELVRRGKLQNLIDRGIDPFGHRIDVTSDSKDIKEKYEKYSKEELHDMDLPVIIAGRIMTKRVKGKAGFMHIQDKFGQIQVYVREDVVGEEQYSLFDDAD
jgi:lysyl-tRNA synthetase class 2